MELMNLFLTVLENKELSPIMADWLMDNRSNYPSVDVYIRKLQNPKTLSPIHLCQVVANYGLPKERKIINKAMQRVKEKYKCIKKIYLKKMLKRSRMWRYFSSDIRSEIQNLIK